MSPNSVRAMVAEVNDVGPVGATGVEDAHVTELCERLQRLGRQAGDGALHAARQRAEALVAGARERAHGESQFQTARAKERLARQRERELQAARLEARASMAWCRWRELDAVVDAAERYVESLRDTESQRYLNALQWFLDSARRLLPDRKLTVRAHPTDLARLQSIGAQTPNNSEAVQIADTNVKAGLLVTSADGSILVDQTIASRRQRLDELLRLAAAEALFGAQEDGSGQTEVDAA